MKRQLFLLLRHPHPPGGYRVLRGLFVVAFVLFGAVVCSNALLDGAGIEKTSATRLVGLVACILLIALLVLSGLRIFHFVREKKRGVSGSMIRMRLSMFFVLASLIPLVLSGLFVYMLVGAGMEIVHNPDIENGLDLSARFVRESRDSLYRDFGSWVRRYFALRTGEFDERWKRGGVFEFRRIGRYPVDSPLLPETLRRHLVGPAEESNLFSEVDGETAHLVYLAVTNGRAEYASMVMHPLYGPGAERIMGALSEYRRLRLVRKPLETALVFAAALFLGLVTLTSLLLAMRFARIIADPLRELVEGTRRIARGELEYRVADVGIDEFAQLVDNFNNMSNELRQSRQRLYHAERIAAWQEVARRLAHEIKNPLTPIQLGAERILRQCRKGSETLPQIIEKMLPAMISEVKAIERLVDEFASFSRLPGKRIERVALAGFIDETLSPVRAAHEEILVGWQLEPGLESAVFDKEQIRRAIVNLVQNSINAVARTERAGRIEILVQGLAGNIMFSIEDNGCGIDPADGMQVFAPYFSRTEGGTGLGLSIVEKIVVDHGGKIWFESSPGGTVFYLCIPENGISEPQAREKSVL